LTGVDALVRGKLGDFALDLAFACPAAKVTAITGPSGAGKTSVLRWLAGLVAIGGRLIVDGEDWRGRPTHARDVGMVFQGQGLLPHLSVAGNLAYAASRARAPMAVNDLAAMTGITHLLARLPAKLSGGEAQRAGLARALVRRPKLLLLDEPLSALDGEARAEMAGLLERILPELGITTVLVSHDRAEVARLAQDEIRMRNGRQA
jgi:molybdate transport system ATP-binding protein